LASSHREVAALIEEDFAAPKRGEVFTEEQIKDWIQPTKQSLMEESKANRG
jgi:hypothetical protein